MDTGLRTSRSNPAAPARAPGQPPTSHRAPDDSYDPNYETAPERIQRMLGQYFKETKANVVPHSTTLIAFYLVVKFLWPRAPGSGSSPKEFLAKFGTEEGRKELLGMFSPDLSKRPGSTAKTDSERPWEKPEELLKKLTTPDGFRQVFNWFTQTRFEPKALTPEETAELERLKTASDPLSSEDGHRLHALEMQQVTATTLKGAQGGQGAQHALMVALIFSIAVKFLGRDKDAETRGALHPNPVRAFLGKKSFQNMANGLHAPTLALLYVMRFLGQYQKALAAKKTMAELILSPEETAELKVLKDRFSAGEALTDEEQEKLALLSEKVQPSDGSKLLGLRRELEDGTISDNDKTLLEKLEILVACRREITIAKEKGAKLLFQIPLGHQIYFHEGVADFNKWFDNRHQIVNSLRDFGGTAGGVAEFMKIRLPITLVNRVKEILKPLEGVPRDGLMASMEGTPGPLRELSKLAKWIPNGPAWLQTLQKQLGEPVKVTGSGMTPASTKVLSAAAIAGILLYVFSKKGGITPQSADTSKENWEQGLFPMISRALTDKSTYLTLLPILYYIFQTYFRNEDGTYKQIQQEDLDKLKAKLAEWGRNPQDLVQTFSKSFLQAAKEKPVSAATVAAGLLLTNKLGMQWLRPDRQTRVVLTGLLDLFATMHANSDLPGALKSRQSALNFSFVATVLAVNSASRTRDILNNPDATLAAKIFRMLEYTTIAGVAFSMRTPREHNLAETNMDHMSWLKYFLPLLLGIRWYQNEKARPL